MNQSNTISFDVLLNRGDSVKIKDGKFHPTGKIIGWNILENPENREELLVLYNVEIVGEGVAMLPIEVLEKVDKPSLILSK